MFGKGQGVFGLRRRSRHRRRGAAAEQGDSAGSSLNEVAPGTTCRVKCLNGRGPIRQRLLDMGIVPGAEITVIRSAPLLDPIEIQIGDSFVTVRRSEAVGIEVSDV